MGHGRALELMWTARRVAAAECLELGLVNRVVPFEDVQSSALELAGQLARGPRTALRYMKANVDRAITTDLKTCLAAEAQALVRCVQTDDHREAVKAFIEKRSAAFDHPT